MSGFGRSAGDEAGVTTVELLVSSAIALTVTASVMTLLNPVQGIFRVQPEVADVQQRLRVGVDALTKDLMMAGAGTIAGASPGPFLDYFAPVLPYRTGLTRSDPASGRYYRADAITLLYAPPRSWQSTLREAIALDAQEVQLTGEGVCPRATGDRLCGFDEKMRVLVFDGNGARDVMTITDLQDPVLRVQYGGSLTVPYAAGSAFAHIAQHTYYLKTEVSTSTFQLMHYDGHQTDLPVIDNVVQLEFVYFGEPQPPMLRPGKSLDDPAGPFTSYGPKPPPIDRDNPNDIWPAGENCVFRVEDGAHLPRLEVLASDAGHVVLPPTMFTDGPWCTDASQVNRFDADLLRIRRVRVRLRVQVAAASLRGPAGALFVHGGLGRASTYVPDQELSFDVTPRNMNLQR